MPKILIVDDSQELLDVFSMIFTANTFDVKVATDKISLYDELSIFHPDVVLMDVRLGGEDGRELCREIKLRFAPQHIAVILLSASPELLRDYHTCGADDVLEKPFDIKSVVQKVNAVLR